MQHAVSCRSCPPYTAERCVTCACACRKARTCDGERAFVNVFAGHDAALLLLIGRGARARALAAAGLLPQRRELGWGVLAHLMAAPRGLRTITRALVSQPRWQAADAHLDLGGSGGVGRHARQRRRGTHGALLRLRRQRRLLVLLWRSSRRVRAWSLGVWARTLGIRARTLGVWARTLGVWARTLGVRTLGVGVGGVAGPARRGSSRAAGPARRWPSRPGRPARSRRRAVPAGPSAREGHAWREGAGRRCRRVEHGRHAGREARHGEGAPRRRREARRVHHGAWGRRGERARARRGEEALRRERV